MTVTREDYRTAAVLCNADLDKLYHFMMLVGLRGQAQQMRSIDKGSLIARIVTRGLSDIDSFEPGELFVLVLVSIMEATQAGASADEMRRALQEVRSELTAREALKRMREGSKS